MWRGKTLLSTTLAPLRYSSPPTAFFNLIEIHEKWRNLEVPFDDPGSHPLHYGPPWVSEPLSFEEGEGFVGFVERFSVPHRRVRADRPEDGSTVRDRKALYKANEP